MSKGPEVILDGYSRRIRIDGHTFVYRPATQGERDAFRHSMKFLSHDIAKCEADRWVTGHVVYGTRPCILPPEAFEKLLAAVSGIIPDASGQTWAEIEMFWRINLRDGVRLEALNPKLAKRSCDHCQEFWYDEKTGKPFLQNSTLLPMRREGGLPPCRVPGLGCLKGTPENQRGLSRENRWAYQHYLRCKAVGSFPQDEIVATNAAIIEKALSGKAAA